MLVFATPSNYHYPHTAQQRAWALQQQRLRNQSISNALYLQQYPSQESTHQLRSINGLLDRVLERDDYLYTQSPYYGYTPNDLAEYEYELALSRATRKAAIQQLHRDYNAAIQRRYAAFQAQRREQAKERELRARRQAAEANGFLADAEPFLGAYWPCGLPMDAELPTQARASTSKVPANNKPDRLEGRMAGLQSIFECLSGGSSPSERVPGTSASPISSQVNVNQEATTSHEGKGKAKEIPESDGKPSPKDRLEERLMDQYQSELSNIFQSILGGLSEGIPTEAPFGRVPVTSAAPTSSQANVNEEATTSSHKGKGKAKEIGDSDGEEEPNVSPAQVASSLSQISSISSRLEALVAGFQFPAELDFSPSRSPSPAYSALDTDDVFALTYTPTNAPLRAQEHALSLLLADLDDVPSFGSHVVRDARRAVVARVGQALEELEKGVEERRGRARARKVDPVTVLVPVEESSEPENLRSADLTPTQVPNEVPTNEFVPALPVEAVAPAASSPIEPVVLDTSIEAPAASIEIATASVAEPSVASSVSIPTASCKVSETLTAEEVSVPQEEKLEEPLVDEVSTVSVSEDAVIIEDTNLPTHVDLTQTSSASAAHATPLPLDTSDAHSQNTLGVFPPDFVSLSHADADIPAEVVNTTDEPASFAPAAAASSFLGSDHEQTPSEVNVPEAEVDTFLLV
jgi:hypothetical protein